MGSDVTGDVDTTILRTPDRFQPGYRREVSDMQPAARLLREPDVALDDGQLCARGPSVESQPRCDRSGAHDGARRQRCVLGMLDERQAERRQVGEQAARNTPRGDRLSVVADAHDAHLSELTDLGHALALTTASRRRHDAHAGRLVSGAIQHECNPRRLVERGIRIGHDADGRVAPVRRSASAGLQGLGAFHARLAQVGMEIAEPRRQHQAIAVDVRCVSG